MLRTFFKSKFVKANLVNNNKKLIFEIIVISSQLHANLFLYKMLQTYIYLYMFSSTFFLIDFNSIIHIAFLGILKYF